MTDGRYRTAVVIDMASGYHTYWKQPGDAGVPPVFAFDGSLNVASAEPMFPAPKRITEDGLDTFGYTDRVVFPIVVTPSDPAKPSSLHLDLNFAVCSKICIPGHSTADLALPANGTADDDAAIAAAIGSVPRPLAASERGDLAIARVSGGKKPTWALSWSGKTAVSDIFADAPEGYAFDTRPGAKPGTWTLTASQLDETSARKTIPVALTLAGEPRSLVTTEDLDVSGSP